MKESQLQRARIISSVAATVISLACGTNYVYSAWAPQFADRLKYSATETNLVGLAGNLGMYSMGIPIGMFVDAKGPRPAVLLGALLLGLGYFPLHAAFDAGEGAVGLMCVFSYLTGFGGCMAFAAAVKTSALNWPTHRGTATAFPLAAFGLSAFFFSLIGSLVFPGDTSGFLMLLALGTFGLTLLGFFSIRVVPNSLAEYHAVSADSRLRRSSQDRKVRPDASAQNVEPPKSTSDSSAQGSADASHATSASSTVIGTDLGENTSLLSSENSMIGDLEGTDVDADRSRIVDIRGFQLLKNIEFWELFVVMGILSGIGLMTINNIGHSTNILWRFHDPTITPSELIARQQFHVSLLSVASFVGRLSSGTGSDFLVKVLQRTRLWCLTIASVVFLVAQICAINITNPHYLGFVSGLSGLGYGFLFGVFPSIAAETFGIGGFSQNWGFLTLSPVFSGNIFNLFYGIVLDKHSTFEPGGERKCSQGLECYRDAYFVTLGACVVGFIVTLLVIRHQHLLRMRERLRDTLD